LVGNIRVPDPLCKSSEQDLDPDLVPDIILAVDRNLAVNGFKIMWLIWIVNGINVQWFVQVAVLQFSVLYEILLFCHEKGSSGSVQNSHRIGNF
jgi:hypothetical protein